MSPILKWNLCKLALSLLLDDEQVIDARRETLFSATVVESIQNYWVKTVKSLKLPHCHHGKIEPLPVDPRYFPEKPGTGPLALFGRHGERGPRFHKVEDLKTVTGARPVPTLSPTTTTTTTPTVATITSISTTQSSKRLCITEPKYYCIGFLH